MPKHQCKNINTNSQGTRVPPQPNYCIAMKPEYFNIAEAHKNEPKINFMKII